MDAAAQTKRKLARKDVAIYSLIVSLRGASEDFLSEPKDVAFCMQMLKKVLKILTKL
jgi:hypothetical protein